MKQWIETLRSARWLEALLLLVLICVLLLIWLSDAGEGADGAASETELRMERILSSIEGAGRVSVMLSTDGGDPPQMLGAVVAATGADEMRVRLCIQDAVRTLTGLELDRIEVVKAETGE